MKNLRRKRLVDLLNGPRFNGDRSAFLASAKLSKGRLTQLLNPKEQFGDTAARNLCEALELPEGWFDSSTDGQDMLSDSGEVLKQPLAIDNKEQVAINDVANALQVLSNNINFSPSKGSDALAGTLVSFSKDPSNPVYTDMLLRLLQPIPRPGVESKDFQRPLPGIFAKTKP